MGSYMSQSSYWFVWVRRSHSGSRVLTRARIAVIRFRVGHSGVSWGGRVHSGARGFAWSGLGVVGFIHVHVSSFGRGHRVHSGSRRFTRALLGVDRRVFSGSRGFTRAHHVVVGFIRIRMG